ncbi:periplasmic binding protein-like II [Cerioporus squamosus]|nr:periplasmic binding protein-like II [Cerioporus squamosus]
MPLRIGYVREHFSSPLLQFAEADGGKTFTLVECPSATNAERPLISRALTDPLISGIAKGSKAYKLVGSYVTTPLNWQGGHHGKDSKYNSISDLKGTTIGISRYGSGSQTMAYVMALPQGWPTNELKFQVNNDIRGLIDSVDDGSTSAFMWEWFTTKPFVDAGEARFIGSVPTPWPSWLIAAHPTRAPPDALKLFLASLTTYFIKEKFAYPEEDIKAWLKTVGYPQDCAAIPRQIILETLSVLLEAGFVQSPEGGFDVTQFVNTDITNLT